MSASRQASSAAEIDNEALRDQVQHLQKQIQTLEDMLEDVQLAAEREEATVRERMRRYKEKEEAMKKELNAGRKEVEQMLKSEAAARGRVEENEEALRESTLALENARAEIEVLRTEIAVSNNSLYSMFANLMVYQQNLDSLAASGSAGNIPQKLTDSVSRATSERFRLAQEIVELTQALEESRASQQDLITERLELRQALDERSSDLDALKKRMNREVPINSGLQEPVRDSRSSSPQSPSSKYDLAAARDEITGLKFVLMTSAHYVILH
jgi:CAP-Gly domain-containing linker protein 1